MTIEATGKEVQIAPESAKKNYEIISPTSGITLIGVHHNIEPSLLPQEQLNTFRRLVTSQKIIAHEGKSKTKSTANSVKNLESLAATYAKKTGIKQVALEDNLNLSELLMHYNFDPHQYTALRLADYVRIAVEIDLRQPTWIKATKFDVNDLYKIKNIIETDFLPQSIVSKKDFETIGSNLYEGIRNPNLYQVRTNMESIRLAHRATTWYKARLRDYEIIGPNFQELCKTEQHPIAAILGMGHLPLLNAFVKQEKIVPPVQWNDVKNYLHPEENQAIDQVLEWAKV